MAGTKNRGDGTRSRTVVTNVRLLDALKKAGVNKSKTNTNKASGKRDDRPSLLAFLKALRARFGIFAALTKFERELIRKRTQTGLAAARAGGRTDGRRLVLL